MGDCYDWKGCVRLENVMNARVFNWAMWLADAAKYFGDINAYLEQRLPHLFRFHIGGDIPDEEYFRYMCGTGDYFPGTDFLCFTKNHELVYDNMDLATPNMQMVYSMWPGWGDENLPGRKAWMQDGTETRVPKDAIKCAGSCDYCGMCWNLDNIGRDVVFTKH